MEGINWTNCIIASSAVISAFSTLVLAWITWRYLRVTQQLRSDAQKPAITIDAYQNDRNVHYLVIENTGKGLAYDLCFCVDWSYSLPSDKLLKDCLPKHIPHLPLGRPKEYIIGRRNSSDDLQKTLKIRVIYKDSENEVCDKRFCVNFRDSILRNNENVR